MSTAKIDSLRDDEVLALSAWIDIHGRTWKTQLSTALNAGEFPDDFDDTDTLQHMAARLGSDFVHSFSAGEIQSEARVIATNWMAFDEGVDAARRAGAL